MRPWWRQPPPCPSSWACVAAPVPARPVVWLGGAAELRRTAWCPLTVPGRPERLRQRWQSCHGDGWCAHCGRQLPDLSPGAATDAVAELRELLARVDTMNPDTMNPEPKGAR